MKHIKKIIYLSLILGAFTGCARSTGEVWEDAKSSGRHVGKGFRTLGGKQGDSRQVLSRDEFTFEDSIAKGGTRFNENEFIPLQDENGKELVFLSDARAPSENPGEPGSSIPGIDSFKDPAQDPKLKAVFKNISFEYNMNLVKGDENLRILQEIADYMHSHPHLYIFVEGHCCEKGPVAYNLALGARRANAVRDLLVQYGASPDNVFTVSYGKERPLALGQDDASIAKNRRAQFKVYER